ncbi:MAG: OB-fold nucleic acid binding domain-containing protein, partial [Anaerolineae bacterium]
MLKTHNCGELGIEHIGWRVTLAGWVQRHRSHGGVVFVNLRDRSGVVQVIFDEENEPAAFSVGNQARVEWVIQVEGLVRRRPEGTKNPDMSTGEVEVVADTAQVLNRAKTPPF